MRRESVPVKEFRKNISTYMNRVEFDNESINITRYGDIIAVISPYQRQTSSEDDLFPES